MPTPAQSIRDKIIAAAVAAVTNTINLANGAQSVYRSRFDPISRGEAPALIVRPLRDHGDNLVNTFKEQHLLIACEVYVRSATNPDALADPIVTDMHQRLMADVTLGSLAIDIIQEDTLFEGHEADQTALIVSSLYRVYYRHQIARLDQ